MNDLINQLLSVVVPVYNVEKYLRRCLDSIINQTYTNLEVILVNDGSTDSSGDICNEYMRCDKRIKVIHKDNGGLVSARKAGVKVAKGAYITHVDSDDWIEHNMYSEMMELIIANDADIVTSGVYRDYEKYAVTEKDEVPEGIYSEKEIKEIIYPQMIYTGVFFKAGINVHVYNKIYRASILKEKQLAIDDRIKIGEDAALVYPCFMKAKKVVVTHNCYYHYCIRDNSIMGGMINQEYTSIMLLYAYLKTEILKCEQCDNLLMQLNYYISYLVLLKEPQAIIKKSDNEIIEPFDRLLVGSNIVLYGAGKFGKAFYKFIQDTNLCDVVLWVDKREDFENGISKADYINKLDEYDYDYIVIGVLVESIVAEIVEDLLSMGIKRDKIVKIDVTKLVNDLFENFEGEQI